MRRTTDALASAGLLVLLSPVMALVGVAVWLSMGRPVLFRQVRLGQHGNPFTLLKFRTMVAAPADRPDAPDEERLTSLGRFLRRWSLDELPELINVLRGEMSLVGPRPLLPEYRDLYSPEQWRRHEVKPGLAGPVQAWGRNALSWEEKFELDVWYIDNRSFWVDVRIVAATARAALRGRGIAAEGHVTMPRFTGSRDTRRRRR